MRIAREEVFGPVLSVIPFDDEDEAVAIANDMRLRARRRRVDRDIGRALRLSERLEAGTVWVNTYRAVSYTSPFGGYKRSGIGRESGLEAIKRVPADQDRCGSPRSRAWPIRSFSAELLLLNGPAPKPAWTAVSAGLEDFHHPRLRRPESSRASTRSPVVPK